MPRTEDLRGFITWARLRRLVLSEPQAAFAQSKVALRLVDPRLRPRVLGILGTSLRVLGDLDGALRVLEVADTEARSCKDYWAAGDALQRQAAVFEYQGELERALRLASEAQAVYASLGDLRSMGRATVDRAAFLAQLDRPRESILAYKGALKLLPRQEHANRFAAFVGLARTYANCGHRREALDWARAATHHSAGLGEMLLASGRELHGLLAFQEGRLSEASGAFREATEIYRSKGAFLDCAFATVWLCICLLEAGQPEEVESLAVASSQLIGHLKGSRFAAGAVAELAAQAVAGRSIDPEFLRGVLKRVQKSRSGAPKGA